jgi:hypothetical protein
MGSSHQSIRSKAYSSADLPLGEVAEEEREHPPEEEQECPARHWTAKTAWIKRYEATWKREFNLLYGPTGGNSISRREFNLP